MQFLTHKGIQKKGKQLTGSLPLKIKTLQKLILQGFNYVSVPAASMENQLFSAPRWR